MSQKEVNFKVSVVILTPGETAFVFEGPEKFEIQHADDVKWTLDVEYSGKLFPVGSFGLTGITLFPYGHPSSVEPIGPGHFFSGVTVEDNNKGSTQTLVLSFDRAHRPPPPSEKLVYGYKLDYTSTGDAKPADWDPSMVIEPGGPWWRRWLAKIFG